MKCFRLPAILKRGKRLARRSKGLLLISVPPQARKGKRGKDPNTLTCILRVAEYECKGKVVIRRGSMKGFNQPYVLGLKILTFEKKKREKNNLNP